MSRSEEFRKSALYHGTTHPFEIGDIVDKGVRGGAWATTYLGTASQYAAKRSYDRGGEPKVYTVEPVNPEDVEDMGMGQSRSAAGFRVTGTVPVLSHEDGLGNRIYYPPTNKPTTQHP